MQIPQHGESGRNSSPPLELIEQEFHLTKSTEQLQEAGFVASHINQMMLASKQGIPQPQHLQADKIEETIPNLHNSSSCIEISNYISRQSSHPDGITYAAAH